MTDEQTVMEAIGLAEQLLDEVTRAEPVAELQARVDELATAQREPDTELQGAQLDHAADRMRFSR